MVVPGMGETMERSSRSEEHTSELQSQPNLVCRLLLEKKKQTAVQLTESPLPPHAPLVGLATRAHPDRGLCPPYLAFSRTSHQPRHASLQLPIRHACAR